MSSQGLPAPDALQRGLIGGKYRLSKQIGVGGMAAVWLARNESTGAEVALKMLLGADAGAQARSRLRREAQVAACLSHRGIVRVYDLVELPTDGGVAVVMECLHGETLADHLLARGRLPVDDAVTILLCVLGALSHAHEAGVVHRDLKPENVFLAADPDGVVTPKLLDFGISKRRCAGARPITAEGEIVGTPAYMSPEQLRADPDVDPRSDVFGAALMLYEMLSGYNPFRRDELQATVTAVLVCSPPPLDDLPPALWSVLRRALDASPSARFPTAAAFAAALRGAVGIAARPSLPPEPQAADAAPPRAVPLRRSRRLAGRTALGFAALGAAALTLALAALAVDPSSYASGAPARRVRAASSSAAKQIERAAHSDLAVPIVGAEAPTRRPSAPSPRPRRMHVARDPGF